ncbi:hypothetical protein SAMN04489712_103368 [Thermomonospora echinospora]|uniref:Uncharacterized protein n=1 Tax=Thermomonospora echinospora TaxID=1992 RepID=A0A1H5XRT0_9ACTN|nr:hypothetical protein [Thermomonospora echinospora]SEG14137.1 hypothetical protein SAMN04489712_103368 [Thermomonospora echinospora]
MPDIITTVLAKALVMALEALLTRLFVHLVQMARYRMALVPNAV